MSIVAVSWLLLFFSCFRICEVSLEELQAELLSVLQTWGIPKAMKFDNGYPFNDPTGKTIPVISLWLIGLGINVIWNRPRTPTDNAKVERNQRTTANWVESSKCANLKNLRQMLQNACRIQREEYPTRVLNRKTRIEVFPQLKQNPRNFNQANFSLQIVLDFMAKGHWVRKVSKVGQVGFFGQRWQAGVANQGKTVFIKLDPEKRKWIIKDEKGSIIKQFPDQILTRNNILNLQLIQ